ncbi:protein of unknown function [Chitinophaga terrae (ex Kim and Jung 2007)]|uniref:DUF4249 domain-containing protein n=1 Tax=Chitinophaga terrae (ex Kim and Jung 2007) TaxID=408074 RepID=A0A1H4F1V3_9BACT|nr:DUF4249 family protein [Chitinophaga terrae (ex Kim and Jung 2007)]MDQ0106442.1 hypothetical protein [Chitinophaga terrae (ex Kim and Jung 2007)]SEA91256.1 protein of unknown function [Chitinophaga terrae (ex Kim and Jung 2007)]
MRHLLIIGSLLCLWIAGCKQDLPLPKGGGAPRAVVYSELVAGKTPEVRVGKSIPVAPGIDNNFRFVTNAKVELQDKNGSPIETLLYQPDSSSVMGLYVGKTVIDANRNYKLQVTVPDTKQVNAMATVPPPFKVELLDTVRTLLNGRPVLKFHLNVYPLPGIRQYVVMEALKQSVTTDTSFTYRGVRYRKSQNRELFEQVKNRPDARIKKDSIFENDYLRIPCYTQDENADNNQIGGLNENYNSILFTQNGKPLTTDFYINATALSSNPAEAIAPVGRVLVYVKSVSKDYYDFLLTYEKVKRNPGLNSLIQAIQLRSNTAGGLGVVGGSFQKIYYLYYDEL